MSTLANDTVVVALPAHDDPYYSHNYANLIAYYHELLSVVSEFHDVTVICNRWSAASLRSCGVLPAGVRLSISDPKSPWIRDSFPIICKNCYVKPIYRPTYQDEFESANIESWASKWLTENHIPFNQLRLILDGGNVAVSPDMNTVILTDRVYKDNSEYFSVSVREMLMEALGVSEVIIIPQERGDVTGHIDSMLRFVNNKKILVNAYVGEFRTKLFKCLQAKLPDDVEIIEIPYYPSRSIYQGFPSASGCYLNFLLTSKCCVIPTFCNALHDRRAVELISKHIEVPVYTVNSEAIAKYGGAINCVAWNYNHC